MNWITIWECPQCSSVLVTDDPDERILQGIFEHVFTCRWLTYKATGEKAKEELRN